MQLTSTLPLAPGEASVGFPNGTGGSDLSIFGSIPSPAEGASPLAPTPSGSRRLGCARLATGRGLWALALVLTLCVCIGPVDAAAHLHSTPANCPHWLRSRCCGAAGPPPPQARGRDSRQLELLPSQPFSQLLLLLLWSHVLAFSAGVVGAAVEAAAGASLLPKPLHSAFCWST